MSMAKLKTQRAAKEYECEACREQILRGESYISYKVGFRSRYVHRRHDLPGCRPKPSERESSLVADCYAAQEDFEAGTYESVDDIESAMQEVAERFREVAQQYDDASTDENGTEWNVEAAERRDIVEAAADELDGWSPSGDSPDEARCAEHTDEETAPDDCEDCTSEREAALAEILEDATGTVNGVELP